MTSDKDTARRQRKTKELTLGWGRGAGIEGSSRAEQIEPMLDIATNGFGKRRKNHVSLEPIIQARRSLQKWPSARSVSGTRVLISQITHRSGI